MTAGILRTGTRFVKGVQSLDGSYLKTVCTQWPEAGHTCSWNISVHSCTCGSKGEKKQVEGFRFRSISAPTSNLKVCFAFLSCRAALPLWLKVTGSAVWTRDGQTDRSFECSCFWTVSEENLIKLSSLDMTKLEMLQTLSFDFFHFVSVFNQLVPISLTSPNKFCEWICSLMSDFGSVIVNNFLLF